MVLNWLLSHLLGKDHKYNPLSNRDGPKDREFCTDTGFLYEEFPILRDESIGIAREIAGREPGTIISMRQKWSIVCSTAMFTISVLVIIVLRQRLDGACLKYREPWSRATDSRPMALRLTIITGPLSRFVKYESTRFDWETCPEDYCGRIQEDRESSWKSLWDCKSMFQTSFTAQILFPVSRWLDRVS